MTDRSGRSRPHSLLRVALLVIPAASLAASVRLASFSDFATYAAGVRRALDGLPLFADFQSAPYPLRVAADGHGFLYPPSAVPLLVPLTLLGPVVFSLGGALSLTLVVLQIVRPVGTTARLAILAVILATPPMLDALRVGQLEPYVAAAFGVTWLAPKTSGWLAVTGGAVKLYPAAGLVWSLRNRAPTGWPVFAGLLLAAASTLWLGPDTWSRFASAYMNGRPTCDSGLPSFACLGLAPAGYILAAGLLATAWRVRDDRISFLVLSLAVIAPATDLWPRYLLVPMVGALPLVTTYLRVQHAAGTAWVASAADDPP